MRDVNLPHRVLTEVEGDSMTTFVLVHGAWAGSFGFRTVRKLLQAAGHEVFTPSLTGLGERVHLASPQVTLSTHVQDVVNQVLYEDLNHIVLLGYSYGGSVITGCLDHIAERVSHLVYLDAFVPAPGQSVLDLINQPSPVIELGMSPFLPPAPRTFDDPDEGVFQNARRVPHPVATFQEPVSLSRPLESFPFSRTYIRATQSDPGDIGYRQFAAAAAHADESDAWASYEIATNHMVLSNKPDELVDLLLRLNQA